MNTYTDSQKRLMAGVAALLTTLEETTKPGCYAVASMVYLAFGSDMDRYLSVVSLCEGKRWIVSTGETLTLTATGRTVAGQLAKAMA